MAVLPVSNRSRCHGWLPHAMGMIVEIAAIAAYIGAICISIIPIAMGLILGKHEEILMTRTR